MRTRKIFAILGLALGLLVWLVEVSEAGAMGTAFTYQGRLIDSNDAADGLYDLTFRLYESDVGETRAANDVNVGDVNVSDGYFTVELDFGNGVFDGDGRWLEIGVRPGEMNDSNVYTTLSPRQEVTPTPYALQTRGIFVDDSGNVGIGTKIPDKKLTVAFGNFAVYPGPSEPSIITDGYNVKLGDPDGMRNQVFLEIDDFTERFVFNNANVGIGTASPTRSLHIYRPTGPANIGLVTTDPASAAQIIFGNSTGNQWTISSDNTDSNKLHFRSGHAVGIPQVTFQQDGKVGIRTTNPQADMEVRHSPGSHRVIKAAASDGSELFYVAEHDALGNGFLGVMDGTGTTKVFITANGNSYFNGGNVAVGKTYPQARLDVDGDLKVSGAYKGDIGPNNGAPFPRPAYNSGWVPIAQSTTITLTHNIGGNLDNYVVDMQFKLGSNIHNEGYGGDRNVWDGDKYYRGAYWESLTNTEIQVYRRMNDETLDQVRVRIWVYN
jgi:hypothetical protein